MNVKITEKFAEFLAARWQGGFTHGYEITGHSAWHTWRARHGGQRVPWFCGSLAEAAQNWSWTEIPGRPTFDTLAVALQQAIANDDQMRAQQVCFELFAWGNVARQADDASRLWVQHQAAAGTLTDSLAQAVDLLSPSAQAPLAPFHQDGLLMNSATTKLYAAAARDGRVAIYDSRVGAALGLLARKFLEEQDVDGVPEPLHYRWGPPQSAAQVAARTRDPSTARHVFLQLPNGGRSHGIRAALSRQANQLFDAVCQRLQEQGHACTFLDLERALFMIGYRVR